MVFRTLQTQGLSFIEKAGAASQKHSRFSRANFHYDKKVNEFTCPNDGLKPVSPAPDLLKKSREKPISGLTPN